MKWKGVVAIILLLLLATSCQPAPVSPPPAETKPTPTPTKPATPALPTVRGQVGEEVANERIAVLVPWVRIADEVVSGTKVHTPVREGDLLVIFELTVRNVKGAPIEVGDRYVALLDSQGNSYRPTVLNMPTPPDWFNEFRHGTLLPDEESTGNIIFSIAKGTMLDNFSYTTLESTIEIAVEREVAVTP